MPALPVTVALRAYYFLTFGVMGIYLPFFPTWLRARGFVGWQMSALTALSPLCQLAAPALVGMLADRFALRGRMMIVCTVTTAFGLSLLTSTSVLMTPLPFAVAASCLLMFAALRSPISGLADVLAMEVAPDYGRMRLWGSLGFMVLALLGGRFLDPTHPVLVPLVISLLCWISVGAAALLPQTSHLPARPVWEDLRGLWSQVPYRHLLFTMMLVFGGMTAYDLCISLRLAELGAHPAYIGTFWATATASEIVLLHYSAPLLRRIGPGKLLTLACAAASLRWMFLAQATSLSLILAMQPLHSISFGLMWVSSVGVLKREVGERGTATAQGFFAMAVAVGATLGLSTWGVLYDAKGSSFLFQCASGVSALAAVSASRLIRFTAPKALNSTS